MLERGTEACVAELSAAVAALLPKGPARDAIAEKVENLTGRRRRAGPNGGEGRAGLCACV